MKRTGNKIAITGASSGIGYAIAKHLALYKYDLLLLARSKDKLERIAKELGPHTTAKKLDVTNYQSIEEALENETIDILINNAGVALGVSKFHHANLEDLNQMIDTNIKGVINLSRYVLPKMIERNQGYIINIGSVLGTYPFPYAHVYGATKSFVEQFSLNLRADLIGTKVRVTVIAPGSVQTECHEQRYATNELIQQAYSGLTHIKPEEIANIVQYCIQLPEHININKIEVASVGQNLWASI